MSPRKWRTSRGHRSTMESRVWGDEDICQQAKKRETKESKKGGEHQERSRRERGRARERGNARGKKGDLRDAVQNLIVLLVIVSVFLLFRVLDQDVRVPEKQGHNALQVRAQALATGPAVQGGILFSPISKKGRRRRRDNNNIISSAKKTEGKRTRLKAPRLCT